MKPKVESVSVVAEAEDIPHGHYVGLWRGYQVIFCDGSLSFQLHLDVGVRDTTRCNIDVDDSGIKVEPTK